MLHESRSYIAVTVVIRHRCYLAIFFHLSICCCCNASTSKPFLYTCLLFFLVFVLISHFLKRFFFASNFARTTELCSLNELFLFFLFLASKMWIGFFLFWFSFILVCVCACISIVGFFCVFKHHCVYVSLSCQREKKRSRFFFFFLCSYTHTK